jgi:hypothetical protein
MTHSHEPVVLEVEGATAWIHLNRAPSANALSHAFVLPLPEGGVSRTVGCPVRLNGETLAVGSAVPPLGRLGVEAP